MEVFLGAAGIVLLVLLQVYSVHTAVGSLPHITLDRHQGEKIQLLCNTEGWFPKPELQWISVKGTDLTGRAVLTEQEADRLYSLQSSLQVFQQEADGITCLIRYGEEKVLQTKVHINGEFFTRVTPAWKGLSAFAVILVLFCILCVPVAIFYSKKKTDNLKIAKQNLEAECDDLRKEIKSKGFVLKSEWKEMQDKTADVTLNPDTANKYLIVSEDGKRARYEKIDHGVSSNNQRLDTYHFVLGREGFTSGSHYWEVEVGERGDWKLGVCSEFAQRRGHSDPCIKTGYWVIRFQNGHELSALTDPVTHLNVLHPQKVGVYLEYEGGKISFYRVEDHCAIYTFQGNFSGKLYPVFHPGEGDLVILPREG
ncbi:butyrophilin subfamily 1 member A1-like [Polyodon spathula]|uniref:butyrophilin subfamily 1 member A1-like n=1 Tax=Polyodon spathula TaxID=7913 RepID=UPI001B7EE2D5|nr:butyrophilin subfamily 1 member A1-like [Polyodon spathula]